MLNNDELTLYSSWNLEKISTPLRSRLYSLEPIGIGTLFAESLTGYIARLAQAHCVLPGVLMERELALFIKQVPKNNDSTKKQGRTGVFGHTGTFNGVGVMALDWIISLSILTLRNDLHFLTMLTWSEVFPVKGLLRNNMAYCPVCFEEMREARQVVYEPLLWAINGVDVCPLHYELLRLQCSYCNQPLSPLAWRSRPGYCSKCGQWLGYKLDTSSSVSRELAEKRLQYQVWIASSIGELIAAQPRLPWMPSREKVGEAFSVCINRMTEGNIAAFARLIGKPRNTVWTWQTGEILPQLSVLVRICHSLGISVLDFLSGNFIVEKLEEARIISQIQLPRPDSSPKRSGNLEQLRRMLETIKDSDECPPLSMEEVAKRLNYNARYLRRHFKDLCTTISARYTSYRKTLHRSRVEQICLLVEQTALEIYAEGEDPTRSRVSKRLAKPAYFRENEVCAALEELRRKLGLKIDVRNLMDLQVK
ncbi:TniQ family protein [Kamptonema sp. UHCC 0994]|uniref:TniQ family protein n=1 Tax=Kamptonema sp. UHCC 0994 TaxID=3031329 RepID=UPI0023BAD34F|nr:TniQ family protein [Kamptonema sp. UHCC 0994]MDF0556351.1 TniQ family protein [Kamptonema sp. UHCC 0994]